jgi:hypothetical protein
VVVVLPVIGGRGAASSPVKTKNEDVAIGGTLPFCFIGEVHSPVVDGEAAGLEHVESGGSKTGFEVLPEGA